MALIGQVQFLNVIGRVGGSNGSASMASFSGGFGWANLELPPSVSAGVFPWRSDNASNNGSQAHSSVGSRRAAKKSKTSDGEGCDSVGENCGGEEEAAAAEEGVEGSQCDFAVIMPSVEKLCTCVVLLVSVFVFRSCVGLVFTQCLHSEEVPTSFRFPAWEARHTHTHTCTLLPRTYAHIRTREHTHTHTHAYTHTHTHTTASTRV